MRSVFGVIVALAITLTSTLSPAGEAPSENYQDFPKVSLVGGIGNSLGWLGIQGERHFEKGRWSCFVGMGYTPEGEEHMGQQRPAPTGVTLAAGGRLFSGGIKHRFFAEASVSQIEWGSNYSSTGEYSTKRRYGPGLQLGYQRIADRGFTLMGSAGVGYAVGSEENDFVFIMGLGLGHTWR